MRSLRSRTLDLQPVAERVEVATAIAATRRGERVPIEQWRTFSEQERGRIGMHAPDFNRGIKTTAERRLKLMDAWPREIREVAHELGPEIVDAFFTAGVRKPNTIRHLVALARREQIDGRPAAIGNKRPGKAP